jgi:repressor LexA
MTIGLTGQQAKVLCCIEDYIKKNNKSPSFQDIANAVQVKSKSGIHRVMVALKERGKIHYIANRTRSITLIQKNCPNCGYPLP